MAVPFDIATIGIHCRVENPPGGLHPSAFGTPEGRWPDTEIFYSVSTSGGEVVSATGDVLGSATVDRMIGAAFEQWGATWSPLTISRLPVGDSRVRVAASFVGADVQSQFADEQVVGNGEYPPDGTVHFTTARTFTETSLRNTALHEFGHALGLTHSGDPASIMYFDGTDLVDIDRDSRDAIIAVYAPWSPQTQLPDRATADRPGLASSGVANFGGSYRELSAVWRGVGDDHTIYHSRLRTGSWTGPERIAGAASTDGPALASYELRDGTPSTGLMMVWKGVPGDSTLWWNVNPGNGWSAPHQIPGAGTSARPAVASFTSPFAAWKGAGDDSGIYWSRYVGGGWAPQARVPGYTSRGPALATVHGRLYCFWRGAGDDSTLWYSSIGSGDDATWRDQQQIWTEDFRYSDAGGEWITPGSSEGPAAASRGDRILLAWKGVDGDSTIYWCGFDGREFSPQLNIGDVGTSRGPGVGSLDERTHMMWKGVSGDNTLWWSVF